MLSASATPGRWSAREARPGGRPVAAAVVAVTSAPLVSWASTRDCAAYVWLNTAVETANEPVRATITRPRDRRARCRDMDAATTRDISPARGRTARARARRPEARTRPDSRHENRAAPIHRRMGARSVT